MPQVLALTSWTILSLWQRMLWPVLSSAAALLILLVRPSRPTMELIALATSSALLVLFLIIGVAWPQTLGHLSQENQTVEYLTATFLLLGALVGGTLAVKLIMEKRPSPLVVFLSAGMFWGFWREQEYGGVFVGEQFWFGRALVRPWALWDRGFFVELAEDVHSSFDPNLLYLVNLIVWPALVLCGLALLGYLWHHRTTFLGELKAWRVTCYARIFAAALGTYVVAELGGALWKSCSFAIRQYMLARGLGHRVFEEPVEFIAALLMALSMLAAFNALWRNTKDDIQTVADSAER